jgi:hypothetical protein
VENETLYFFAPAKTRLESESRAIRNTDFFIGIDSPCFSDVYPNTPGTVVGFCGKPDIDQLRFQDKTVRHEYQIDNFYVRYSYTWITSAAY